MNECVVVYHFMCMWRRKSKLQVCLRLASQLAINNIRLLVLPNDCGIFKAFICLFEVAHIAIVSAVYSQFAPLQICPSNQLAPRKYGASRYPMLPAKLLAAICQYQGLN